MLLVLIPLQIASNRRFTILPACSYLVQFSSIFLLLARVFQFSLGRNKTRPVVNGVGLTARPHIHTYTLNLFRVRFAKKVITAYSAKLDEEQEDHTNEGLKL
jgi:hypothetical protein